MGDPVNWNDPWGLSGNLVVNGHEINHTMYRNGAMYGSIRDFANAVGASIVERRLYDNHGNYNTTAFIFGFENGNVVVFLDGTRGTISSARIPDPYNPGYVRIIANLQRLVNLAGSSVTSLGYNVGTAGGTFRPSADSRTTYHIVGRAPAMAVSAYMAYAIGKLAYEQHGRLSRDIVMSRTALTDARIFDSATTQGVSLFVTRSRSGISVFGIQTDLFSTKAHLRGHVSRINGMNVFELQDRNVGLFLYGRHIGFKIG